MKIQKILQTGLWKHSTFIEDVYEKILTARGKIPRQYEIVIP